MSSASSSIETPALIRRTFAWLSTKRLKGMSRDRLRVIFCLDFDISVSPRRAAESPSLDLLTRHEAGAALLLLRAAPKNRPAKMRERWKSAARTTGLQLDLRQAARSRSFFARVSRS